MINKVNVIIKPKETVIQSFIKDLVTFSFLGLCIYISEGSTWWTFFSGVFFIVFLATQVKKVCDEQLNVFNNINDAIEYLENKKG